MSRMLNLFLTLMLTSLLFSGCKNAASKQSAPQPSTASDPACKSQSLETCNSQLECAVDGAKCVGSGVYCGGFKDSAQCPRSSCDWSGKVCVSGVTQAAPVVAQCAVKKDLSECNASVGCSWTGTLCMNVSTPPQCTAYTAGICPSITGCSVVNNLCEAQVSNNCSNYSTQPTCAPVTGCAWDGVVCKAANAVVNCALNNSQPLCAVQNMCTWVGNSCVNIQTTNTCQGYLTQPSCPKNLGCVWNGTACNVAGVPTTNCASLAGNATTCDGTKGCQWMNNTCVPSMCAGLTLLKCAYSPNCTYIPFAGCYPNK